MVVYVINKYGKPLMPCSPRKARILLKLGKAKVIKRTPFTIKLIYGSSGYTQPLIHGVDTGSDKIGSAVVNDKEEVVILSLDYIKRVRPTRTDAAATASEKTELNAVMNELKSMIAVRFDIPVVSGHQLNRMGATAVDEMIAKGGHNKT